MARLLAEKESLCATTPEQGGNNARLGRGWGAWGEGERPKGGPEGRARCDAGSYGHRQQSATERRPLFPFHDGHQQGKAAMPQRCFIRMVKRAGEGLGAWGEGSDRKAARKGRARCDAGSYGHRQQSEGFSFPSLPSTTRPRFRLAESAVLSCGERPRPTGRAGPCRRASRRRRAGRGRGAARQPRRRRWFRGGRRGRGAAPRPHVRQRQSRDP